MRPWLQALRAPRGVSLALRRCAGALAAQPPDDDAYCGGRSFWSAGAETRPPEGAGAALWAPGVRSPGRERSAFEHYADRLRGAAAAPAESASRELRQSSVKLSAREQASSAGAKNRPDSTAAKNSTSGAEAQTSSHDALLASFARLVRSRPLDELVPVVRAQLSVAEAVFCAAGPSDAHTDARRAAAERALAAAEHMHALLVRHRRGELQRLGHAGVQNVFLAVWLGREGPRGRTFLSWRARILGRSECQPDALTHALVLRAALRAGTGVGDALALLRAAGHSLAGLDALGLLSPDELRAAGLSSPAALLSEPEDTYVPYETDATDDNPGAGDDASLPEVATVASKSAGVSYLERALQPVIAAARRKRSAVGRQQRSHLGVPATTSVANRPFSDYRDACGVESSNAPGDSTHSQSASDVAEDSRSVCDATEDSRSESDNVTEDSSSGSDTTEDSTSGSDATEDSSSRSDVTEDSPSGSDATKDSPSVCDTTEDSPSGIYNVTEDSPSVCDTTEDSTSGSDATEDSSSRSDVTEDSTDRPTPPAGWTWAELRRLQEDVERQCFAAAAQQARGAREQMRGGAGRRTVAPGAATHALVDAWHAALVRALSDDALSASPCAGDAHVAAVLATVDVSKAALIVLQELVRPGIYDAASRGVPLVRLAAAVGRAVEHEALADALSRSSFLRAHRIGADAAARMLRSHTARAAALRRAAEEAARGRDALVSAAFPAWPERLRAAVGAHLVAVAVRVCVYVPGALLGDGAHTLGVCSASAITGVVSGETRHSSNSGVSSAVSGATPDQTEVSSDSGASSAVSGVVPDQTEVSPKSGVSSAVSGGLPGDTMDTVGADGPLGAQGDIRHQTETSGTDSPLGAEGNVRSQTNHSPGTNGQMGAEGEIRHQTTHSDGTNGPLGAGDIRRQTTHSDATHSPLGAEGDIRSETTHASHAHSPLAVPAFEHRVVAGANRRVGFVFVRDRALLEALCTEAGALPVEPWALPMLHPPAPWLSTRHGGYLTARAPCVRVRDGDRVQLAAVEAADAAGRLAPVLRGLSVLGATPWAVSAPVLRVALALWNRGVDVSTDAVCLLDAATLSSARRDYFSALNAGGGDPPGDPEGSGGEHAGPLSDHCDSGSATSTATGGTISGGAAGPVVETAGLPPSTPSAGDKMAFRPRDAFQSQREYAAHVAEVMAARQAAAEAHSARCNTNYMLAVARALAALRLPFYLPHSVDFRGRAYPVPPHLSPVGCDLARGLLRFAHGRPLGPEGLFWLKVHAANAAGHDKAPLAARAAYAEAHAREILAAADDPLGPAGGWWRAPGREDPWQCLAAAQELAAALRAPDPRAHVSALPVQQDGSCNGLQHYAALGRDVDGARQVNVIPPHAGVPGGRSGADAGPQDVYAAVAALVNAQIERDAALGLGGVSQPEGQSDTADYKQSSDSNSPTVDSLRIRGAVVSPPSGQSETADYKLASVSGSPPMNSIGTVGTAGNDTPHGGSRSARPSSAQACPQRKESTHPADESPAEKKRRIARLVLGHVGRKTVKQSVMTTVYGVTAFGARRQVEARLREDAALALLSPRERADAAAYVADAVFASLGAIFERAGAIQRWLAHVADEIGRSVPPEVSARLGDADAGRLCPRAASAPLPHGAQADATLRYPQTLLGWTTPLGFEACQPYVVRGATVLRTQLQALTLRTAGPGDAVDLRRQTTAFPPNYVHSLDAAHMFMTAEACRAAGIAFASVHDCFWTHAADVGVLGAALRAQFARLHARPLLDELRADLRARYGSFRVPVLQSAQRGADAAPPAWRADEGAPPGDIRRLAIASWRPVDIPPPPAPSGSFDVSLVLQSRYFFS